MAKKYKFEKTSCSSCGREFGPGDHGYSHCINHKTISADAALDLYWRLTEVSDALSLAFEGEEKAADAYGITELLQRADIARARARITAVNRPPSPTC